MIFSLNQTSKHSRARAGTITTAHGNLETPFFMPIATRGAVRVVPSDQLAGLGAQIVLSNTYHLFLRPGEEILEKAGGLHKFMNWSKPILTDSGGFQIFSLSDSRTVSDEGVVFKSPIDGAMHKITPERSVEIQATIGSDIAMILDEVVGWPVKREEAADAVDRTTAWAKRSQEHIAKLRDAGKFGPTEDQAHFGIIQGSTFQDLRMQSADELVALDFQGYAIGGLSVGEPMEQGYDMVDAISEVLPEQKPRYVMGVGTPEQILAFVKRGIDMFDVVLPTRNARHGNVFVRETPWAAIGDAVEYNVLNLRNAKYKDDFSPLDPADTVGIGAMYSRAYLRHLFMIDDPVAKVIATMQNLAFYFQMMRHIRAGIAEGILFRRPHLV